MTCDFCDDRCRIAATRLENDIFVKTHVHTSPIVVKKGDAASRRGLSRVGYFIPLNGPLNGHPPCITLCIRHQFVNSCARVVAYRKGVTGGGGT